MAKPMEGFQGLPVPAARGAGSASTRAGARAETSRNQAIRAGRFVGSMKGLIMGLKRIWGCDRCGREKNADPLQTGEQPPSKWKVISFTPEVSMIQILLCDTCMIHLYDEFILKGSGK
jgi:hypothetical protein